MILFYNKLEKLMRCRIIMAGRYQVLDCKIFPSHGHMAQHQLKMKEDANIYNLCTMNNKNK